MSTVNCPNCNKPNIEGSKFCNSCGSALPLSTHIICPNCETRNPRNLLYCDNCGTRLSVTGELSSRREEEKEPEAETRTPRAFSLPAREPGDELDPDNLLDWLKTGEKHPGIASGQEAVLDDWLNELSDVESSEAHSEEELSEWFQDVEDGEEESEGLASWFSGSDDSSDEGSGLSDWLAELEETEDDEDESGESAVDETIPDWLSELDEEDSSDVSGEDSLADWLSDFSLEEETADETAEMPVLDIFSPVDSSESDSADTLIAPSPLQEDEEALPDWLSEPEPDVKEPAVQAEDAEEEVEVPDWLSNFESDEETPTLIASIYDEDDEEELPDWLSGIDDDMPTMIASSPETEEEEALPDWLSESAPEAEAADEEALPDWLGEAAPEEEVADEETLPDWLSETVPEGDTADEEALPDWLSEDAPEEETAGTPSFTDWLSEADLEEAEAVEEGTGLEGLAGWLTDFESEAGETAEEETERPDWLDDFSTRAEEPELASIVSETAADETLPDWLSDFDEGDRVAVEETASQDEEAGWEEAAADESTDWDEIADDGGEMPDWLSEMPSYDTRTLSAAELEAEDSPDLFAELGDPNLTPVDELPDWLSEIAVSEEPEVEDEAAGTDDEDDGFPEWMAELSEEVDNFDPGGDTDWLAALAREDEWPEVADSEEIVAQFDDLKETPAESKGPSQELRGVPKELAGSRLPDWLKEDMPESEFDSDEIADDDPFGVGAEQLTRGELPDWLQQMKPAEVDPTTGDFGPESDETQDEWQKILENMPPSPETMTGASGLSSAEIPAWLQALKPRDMGEAEEDLLESDEPPEKDGPLIGLRGVLPVAPVMTESVAAKTPAQYTISKDQQQQIALLHRLTHEEQEATKQVSFKQASTFSSAWRALLGILLFVVVLAGVILPRTDIGLPETSLPVPQSAFDAFDRVNEAAGRSVLVAFEYTPAMAGELDPIAQMLLRQLADNGNRVLTISQSAVGTALADQAVAEVDGLDSRALPLLPGEAVGLRNLGSCLNSPDDCGFLLGTAGNPELQAELSDIGLIIVVTSDRNSLVNWIEQVERQKEVPVIAAVTQPLGPLTIPYVSSGQLEGSLNGIPAASAYEKRLRGLDGSAFEQFTAQTIVMWVVIIALIVAAVVYGAAGLAGRGSSKGNG